MPNPESALNEEAGKLLLEHYDDYFQRAKMMTEIHAQVSYLVLSICIFPWTDILYSYLSSIYLLKCFKLYLVSNTNWYSFERQKNLTPI